MKTGKTKRGDQKKPLYQVIADNLRTQIESGELGSAARLPTEADLSEEYRTTRTTVRHALQTLIDAQLVEKTERLGYYVREIKTRRWRLADRTTGGLILDPWADQLASRPPGARQNMTVRIDRATKLIRGRPLGGMLGIGDDALVLCRSAVRYLDGQPVELNDAYIPYGLVSGEDSPLMSDTSGSVLAMLTRLGYRVTGWRDIFTPRIPTETEVARLELPEATPVADLLRQIHFDDGRCLLVVHAVYRGDGAEFETDVRT